MAAAGQAGFQESFPPRFLATAIYRSRELIWFLIRSLSSTGQVQSGSALGMADRKNSESCVGIGSGAEDNSATNSDIEEQGEETGAAERTYVADRLDRLKRATLNVVNRRERLPQPLFWSLFHTEVDEIRKKRKQERVARCAFLGIDEY